MAQRLIDDFNSEMGAERATPTAAAKLAVIHELHRERGIDIRSRRPAAILDKQTYYLEDTWKRLRRSSLRKSGRDAAWPSFPWQLLLIRQ